MLKHRLTLRVSLSHQGDILEDLFDWLSHRTLIEPNFAERSVIFMAQLYHVT